MLSLSDFLSHHNSSLLLVLTMAIHWLKVCLISYFDSLKATTFEWDFGYKNNYLIWHSSQFSNYIFFSKSHPSWSSFDLILIQIKLKNYNNSKSNLSNSNSTHRVKRWNSRQGFSPLVTWIVLHRVKPFSWKLKGTLTVKSHSVII